MMLLLKILSIRNESIDVFLSGDSDYLKPAGFDQVKYIYKTKKFFPYIGMSKKREILNLLKYITSYLGARSSKKYSGVIGIDPAGIILADHLTKLIKAPSVYVSFEIMFNKELSAQKEKKIKKRELAASRRASLILIQDKERANALGKENSLSSENMLLVPNSPAPQSIPQSDFLRETLSIPPDKKIVLYCGQLAGYCSSSVIKAMVTQWPDEFVLVIHMRQTPKAEMLNPFLELVQEGRVFISDEPLPNREMTKMISSADYGLAVYHPCPDGWTTGKNIFHMGFSSGKVAHYAMCGLPVIASSLPVFQREFKNYDCGRTYNDPAETGAILTMLDKDYSFHSRESKRFYDERLHPQKPMDIFCDRLIALGKR
jgi:hypothetical protein